MLLPEMAKKEMTVDVQQGLAQVECEINIHHRDVNRRLTPAAAVRPLARPAAELFVRWRLA